MSILKVNTIQDKGGNAIISSDGSGNLTLSSLATGALSNTPLFFANKNANQTMPDQTDTKVTFPNEMIDTDSAFASDRFTVPTGKAGKYYFFAMVYQTGSTDQSYNSAYLFRNGSVYTRAINRFSGTTALSTSITAIMDLSVGDYVEVYHRQNSGSAQIVNGESQERRTFFGGYRMIGA